MSQHTCYENYPLWIVAIAIFLQLSIYVSGGLIIINLGLIWLIFYLIYILFLEIRLMKKSCTKCYYYGKICFSGKGRLCSIFFKQPSKDNLADEKISFISILPDILTSLIPIAIGIILLINQFSWIILSSIIMLVFLTFIGNGLVRGSLACTYCRQRELGCPAEQLFNKNKS